MNKRNKGKSKKQKNPQPQPNPKVASPAEVLPPDTADDTTDTKSEETRVPEIKAEVVTSALIETSQEDKVPEKPKRNKSKRNKNNNENKSEIPNDKVAPSVEIKLPEKELESNKPIENRKDNIATDPILEKEVAQSIETPTTTSRKKNKNKNKNQNVNQPTLTNQPLEAEKEEKAKIDSEVQKQKEADLAKLNNINSEKGRKQDNTENVSPAASRKKKGKKNKSQYNTSDNTDKPVQDVPYTSDDKTNPSNTQNVSATNVTEISKNTEKKNEKTKSNMQSGLKVMLNTSLSPDAQKLVNLVTPDLETITNLSFEIEELSDKSLSKTARKRAKKNQNKNQSINQATQSVDLTHKDKTSITQFKIENAYCKQDNNNLSVEKINTEATNEPSSSCPLDVLKDSENEELKEKDYLTEIKQSLDRSLEELITIEKEQIDKLGTDADSTPSDCKPNIDNKLIGSDNKKDKPQPFDTTQQPVANNFQIAAIPNESFKEIYEQLRSEETSTCSESKTVIPEPNTNEDNRKYKKDQLDKIYSTKIEPEAKPLKASTIKAISKIEKTVDPKPCKKQEEVKINVNTQKTKNDVVSSQEPTIKEKKVIQSFSLQENVDLAKIEESTKLVITGKQDETELKKNDKTSGSEIIAETMTTLSEQISQKGNQNKSKNNKPAQVSQPKDTSVPILKQETNKTNASSQRQEEINVDSVMENEQENNIVEKSKELENKSSKGEQKNNMSVNIAKPVTVPTQTLEKVKQKDGPAGNVIDSNVNISEERTPEKVESKSNPALSLPEKLDEISKAQLSDDLEIIPELIPLTVLDVQNENKIFDFILNTPESVKEISEEFSVPAELPYVQQLAPKQDKGKGQTKKGGKIPSPKPTEDVKQSTAEIVEKNILNLAQKIDSVNSEPAITKQDDIEAEFEMIAQGAIKKDAPKDKSLPSTVQSNKQKSPVNKPKINKPLQEEKTKVNRSKNCVGPPDIPVISSKDDYKKEKNKKSKNKSKDTPTSAPSFNGGQKQKDGFGSECDDEEFIYKYSFRKVFMANACHICKASLKSHRIVCSYCNLVSYCGQKHKDEDWPQHQALCFAISTIVHLKGLKFVYSDAKSIGGQDYRLLRMQTIVSCEKILKRKLTPCEQEILLYPRMCLDMACREWKSAVLKDCDVCGQVSYCKGNPSHLLEEHKKWCDSYKLYYKLVAHQQHKGRIEPQLPTKVISDPTFKLPAKTTDLVKELYEGKLDLDDVHYAALTQIATAPLTALYGYQQYLQNNSDLLKDDTSFTIHVVGAELQFEADMLSKWEMFFLHLHPAAVDLKIVFIGPELNPSKLPLDILAKIRLCKECRQAKRNLTFEFQDGLLYHNFAKSDKFSRPNLVCAFNPGFHRTTGYGGHDTWPDTIKVILALGGPACVTSYTSYELPRDLARIQECWPRVHIQTDPQPNPYASVRPDRNFISDDEMPLIFKNYYFMVITG